VTGNAGLRGDLCQGEHAGVGGVAAGGCTLAVVVDVADDQGGRVALAVGARSGG